MPNTRQIRKTLQIAFDDAALDAFCSDFFFEVKDNFGRGMRKDEKITLLLEHCRRGTRFQELLNIVRQEYSQSNCKQEELSPLIDALEAYLNPSGSIEQESRSDLVAVSRKRGTRPLRVSNQQEAIAAKLEQSQGLNQSVHRARRRYKIDYDGVLRDFDLDEQIAHFTLGLKSAVSGIFFFTTPEKYEILAKYLIPRMQDYMLKRMARQNILHREVWVHSNDLANAESDITIVEHKLAAIHNIVGLADLFNEQRVDSMLTIVNTGIPLNRMKLIANSFLDKAKDQLLLLLQQSDCLFVVVWANLDSEPLSLDEFYPVPPLQTFDPTFVMNWFQKQLSEAKVDDRDIEACVKKLKNKLANNGGYPPATYSAMETIIRNLQRGIIK